MQRHNPVFAKYKLACTQLGCAGTQIVEQAQSAGLLLGSMVPFDPNNPSYGRCPRCRRNHMKVVEAPPSPKPRPPKGFTKVPTE